MNEFERRPNQVPRNANGEPLLDLQRFLAEEADALEEVDFSRAFVPLTDGLGLNSPPKKAAPPEAVVTAPAPAPVPAPVVSQAPRVTAPVAPQRTVVVPVVPAPIAPPVEELPVVIAKTQEKEVLTPSEQVSSQHQLAESRRDLATALNWSGERVLIAEEDPATAPVRDAKVPPPVPPVSVGRRLFATVLDQVFALTMWAIALGITSLVMGQASAGESMTFETLARDFREPAFWRFAMLEYATLWLAHMALGIGILDRTFGMWVWGLKIRYTGEDSDSRFLRKVARIVGGFVFFAPVVPSVLLIPRHKERNFLDWCTGTALYRTLE